MSNSSKTPFLYISDSQAFLQRDPKPAKVRGLDPKPATVRDPDPKPASV